MAIRSTASPDQGDKFRQFSELKHFGEALWIEVKTTGSGMYLSANGDLPLHKHANSRSSS